MGIQEIAAIAVLTDRLPLQTAGLEASILRTTAGLNMLHLDQIVEVPLLLTIEVRVQEQLHQPINVLLHQVDAVLIQHLPDLLHPLALLVGVAEDLQEVQEVAVAEVEEGINSLFFSIPYKSLLLSNNDFFTL